MRDVVMLQVSASYVYHCFEQDLGIHLGKAVDLHVACFKEMIRRSHGMPLPPIKTPLLKLTTMHGMPPRRAADGSSAMDDKQQKTPTMHGPSLTPFHHARRKPRELSPRAGAVEGHGRARWRPGHTRSSARGSRRWRAARGEARAPVSRGRADAQGKTNRRRHEEEEKGRRCSTRKKRRGSICAWHWWLYTWEIYSRCQPPAGSKGPLLPVRITNRE